MTTPAAPAGVIARIEVAESTSTSVALTVANLTEVAPVKLVPVMMTVVPPATGPTAGLSPVTVDVAM